MIMAKNRIEFEQISESEIEVIIPTETPMEMVVQLTKSFIARGLVENLQKSTLSVRYFTRPSGKVDAVADQLIKSLSNLIKEESPYSLKSKFANQKRVREMDIATRRGLNGVKAPANVSTAPQPLVTPNTAPKAPATPPAAPAPKMFDSTPAAQNTAGGSGKRYAFIGDKVAKQEDEEDEMNKGPGFKFKGGSTYSVADNARRKSNNTGDETGFGTNVNTKSYSSKPGQLSAKGQASVTAKIQAKANKNAPVKIYTDEEKAALASKMGLKKSWGQHLPFPSAEEEILRFAKGKSIDGETAAANQLANLMAGKAMLNNPPPQPTDEQMFGHLAVTEDMEKANEKQWQGAAFDWLKEAQKPLAQKFSSDKEEQAYWDNIKVADRDDGKSGY